MDSKIKTFHYKNELVARVVPSKYQTEKTTFFTNDDEPLQVGFVRQKTGAAIVPHFHPPHTREIRKQQEVLYVVEGTLSVKLLTPEGNLIDTVELHEGDLFIQFSQGHSFAFHKNTKLLEVKSGPFTERVLV